jgi:hypothetical protein
MNLNSLNVTTNMVFVNPTYAYIVLAIIAAGVILMWLMVKSSGAFSVEDTEANAEVFAGTISESQGPITKWLWVAYAVMIIWAVAYLIQHMSEFVSFP